MITFEAAQKFLNERFGGRLAKGAHPPGDVACAVEFFSQLEGHWWTDDPVTLNLPDLRYLNDGFYSSKARTDALLPLYVAVAPVWRNITHRERWVQRVVFRTTTEVLPLALRAVGAVEAAQRCEAAYDLPTAEVASGEETCPTTHYPSRLAHLAASQAARAVRELRSGLADAAYDSISATAYWTAVAVRLETAGDAWEASDNVLALACRIQQEEATNIVSTTPPHP